MCLCVYVLIPQQSVGQHVTAGVLRISVVLRGPKTGNEARLFVVSCPGNGASDASGSIRQPVVLRDDLLTLLRRGRPNVQ